MGELRALDGGEVHFCELRCGAAGDLLDAELAEFGF